MRNNITTHHRFIKKAEKDLVQLFKEGDSETFVERYQSFCKLSEPDIRLEEMYYESLDDVQEYQRIIDYALSMMNNGKGDYQLHMIELLGALDKQERYYDVISFADQLMEENISQGFRIEVANARHKAKLKMEESAKKHTRNFDEVGMEDIDFNEMIKEDILQFLAYISEQDDDRYTDKVREALKNDHPPEVITFMLLYLKDMKRTGTIEFLKFNQTCSVVLEELPDLEQLKIINDVLPRVVEQLEKNAPEMTEEVQMLLTGHAIFSYPDDSPIEVSQLTDAYLSYLYSMINLENGVSAADDAMQWILNIEKQMNPDI